MKALRHWMQHNDTLAAEFDAILKLSPGYNPLRLIDPAITFFASLLTNPNDIRGKIGNFSRASSGVYRASDDKLAEAAADISRHQWLSGIPIGLFMELASTNKCQNWNANPDLDLVNVAPPAFRILDSQKIAEAGLDRICHSSYAICIDNIGGGSSVVCFVDGATGNTNPHIYSGYGRVDQGEGRINQLGGGSPFISFTSQNYERKQITRTPTDNARTLVFQAQPNSKCYFLLNQLEEQQILTSPIITKGAASTRALDQVSWPLGSPSFVDPAQGMGAVRVQFPYRPLSVSPSAPLRIHWLAWDGTPDAQQWFLYTEIADNRVEFFVKGQMANSNDVTASIRADEVLADQPVIVAFHWIAGSVLQIGFKFGGVWKWSNISSQYAQMISQNLSLFSFNNVLSHTQRDLYFWNENRGIAWLEDFFSDVAN